MRAGLLVAALSPFALLAGCAGDQTRSRLDVSAATSLKPALTSSSDRAVDGDVRLAFGGSDVLAAQIRAGGRPDVYVAANIELPQALAREGIVEPPVVFAGNELVLAVPSKRARVSSLAGLARPGLRIAIGAPSVPIGAYTRRVLEKLDATTRQRVSANVRSREPDVAGIVGKLTQGAVDAGFVYRTDVAAASGRLRAIELPARLRPLVLYAAAVVNGTNEPLAAHAYIRDLVAGHGARALRAAGFTAPP